MLLIRSHDRCHMTVVTRQIRKAEMELTKGENMIEHKDEIFSRPARTWFQSSKEKAKSEGTATLCAGFLSK